MLTTADRVEIDALCRRYAVLVDTREFAGLAELFSDDAVMVLPDPPAQLRASKASTGRHAIVKTLRTVEGLVATSHAVLASTVDDGDTADRATGLVSGQAHHVSVRRGELVNHVWFIRYADAYRRIDGRWRFSRREVDLGWIERRPVLLPRPEAIPTEPW